MSTQVLTASNVQLIPASSRRYPTRKIRAACYARVSSEHDSQQMSYATQKSYFIDYIESQENLEFAGFYGDEAISGTNRTHRVQFNQMMEDAKAHKFDLILTKSLSRWARNTLDALACIRELKALDPPVRVIFQKENIDTGNAQGELVLTIMSALAQEESRSISENIRWSLQKKFQNGEPIIDLKRTIGYDKGENGEWVINPEQAVIVKMIYESYADGYSSTAIANMLNENGITTVMGYKWRSDGVLRVLRNEIYAGHLLLQKTATVDFLTHKSVKNQTILPQYFIEDHHPAIIEPELLSRVQEQLKKAEKKRTYMKTNGRETCPFVNLKLADGSPLKRISYRAMATGYQKVDGSGGYSFQYPVLKTVNLHIVPGTEKTYIPMLAVEQSFMEMLYKLKREYEKYGEDCDFCREVEQAISSLNLPTVDKQKIVMIEAELKVTGDAYNRASAGKKQAELAGRDTSAYAELMHDLSQKMEQLNAQKSELESVMNGTDLHENYRAFLEVLEKLPTVNALGKPIIVNSLDCDGTLIVESDGSINENRLTGIRRKTFRITPERIDSAPELLTFDNEVYRTFIKTGVVFGDVIEYETTFGVKLRTTGNTRTLKQFLGFKRVHPDKTVDYLTATYQVNGGSVNRKEKKTAKGKKKK
ncbi:MAG: recombinase family protein [Ruminococcus sp.]|nr:recombinase family protein [Ruminococcus sp.]